MTEQSDVLLEQLVHAWPARFRYQKFLVALAAGADPEQLGRSLVEGIAADQDENSVFDSLLADGRFAVAETMLLDCPALDRRRLATLTRQLDTVRSRREGLLLSEIEQLSKRAELAGLAFTADRDELLDLCRNDWHSADGRLAGLKKTLVDHIEKRKAEVGARIDALDGADPAWLAAYRAMADLGMIMALEGLLDGPGAPVGGPAAVPPLPPYRWRESPEEVLGWHLDPATRRPPAFSAWSVRDGSAEHGVLDTYYALRRGGGVQPAVDFALALDRFLGQPEAAKTAHQVEGGRLTTVAGLFDEPDLAMFRSAGEVDLYVADPDTRTVPPLEGLAPFLAVGWGLGPSGYAHRTHAAVIDLRSLLRLVQVRTRRQVALLRVAGPQWPLGAFTETPLLEDREARRQALPWIVDLAGPGDLTAAAALTFETGLDPGLIRLFLDLLFGRPQSRTPIETLAHWSDDAPVVAAVRAAVLAPMAGSPAAEVAFWAAAPLAIADRAVTVNEIIREITLVDGPITAAVEQAVRAGIQELAALPLVAEATQEGVLFRRSGVLIQLAAQSGDALAVALSRLATARAVATSPAQDAWTRHAHLLFGTGGAQDVDGRADLAEVLGRLRPLFEPAHPQIELVLAMPGVAPVAIRTEALEALLYELLNNAAEAIGAGGGTIRVQAESSHGDLTIEVQDSGPGIAESTGDHRIFRRGTSTRGAGRGDGLYRARSLAQQAGGELLLSARRGVHPVLKGAHFKVVLPQD